MRRSLLDYPTHISGLAITDRPNNPGHLIALTAETTISAAESLVRDLPATLELSFFDTFHPTLSDPGAYVSVRIHDGMFVYKLGNHGWSSDWRITSAELMIQYLYINRHVNSDTELFNCVQITPAVGDVTLR